MATCILTARNNFFRRIEETIFCDDFSHLKFIAKENKINNVIRSERINSQILKEQDILVKSFLSKAERYIDSLPLISPIHIAAKNGDEKVVKYLLEQGCDPSLKVSCLINLWLTHEVTPLHLASLNGHVAIAKLLLDYGADINAKCFHQIDKNDDILLNETIYCTGFTPLMFAAKAGQLECIEILSFYEANLQCFFEVRTSENTIKELTIFHSAAILGQVAAIDVLVDKYKKRNISLMI
ncbi:MAG: transient receptor potential cation channel subfamily er 1-like [Rickettsiaceae bacterium]|jgi:ankyrin repeat protein|nr:transient receptor potential cation channel subfamily er 1-like [Rickettsiaceae bacterium]